MDIRKTAMIAMVLAAAALGSAPAAGAQSTPEQGPGGPILVVTDPGDPFGTYYAEILRAEGLNEFAVTDTANLNAGALAGYQVVLLAQTLTDAAQVQLLDGLGPGRRQPHRDAARRAAGRPARPRRPTGDVCERLPQDRHGIAARAPASPAQTMQFHDTADR